MVVKLTIGIEEQLRDLALKQGREIGMLVEEAVRGYLEAATITDLTPGEVAEAQIAMMGEFSGITEWKDDSA